MPFAVAAMEEIGIDIKAHRPMTFEELDDLEGLNFDLIVTLSPEAHHKALELTRTLAAEVEYWPTADPTAIEGSREQRMNAYRDVRDQLLQRIRARFALARNGGQRDEPNSDAVASCRMASIPLVFAPSGGAMPPVLFRKRRIADGKGRTSGISRGRDGAASERHVPGQARKRT